MLQRPLPWTWRFGCSHGEVYPRFWLAALFATEFVAVADPVTLACVSLAVRAFRVILAANPVPASLAALRVWLVFVWVHRLLLRCLGC